MRLVVAVLLAAGLVFLLLGLRALNSAATQADMAADPPAAATGAGTSVAAAGVQPAPATGTSTSGPVFSIQVLDPDTGEWVDTSVDGAPTGNPLEAGGVQEPLALTTVLVDGWPEYRFSVRNDPRSTMDGVISLTIVEVEDSPLDEAWLGSLSVAVTVDGVAIPETPLLGDLLTGHVILDDYATPGEAHEVVVRLTVDGEPPAAQDHIHFLTQVTGEAEDLSDAEVGDPGLLPTTGALVTPAHALIAAGLVLIGAGLIAAYAGLLKPRRDHADITLS
jgi:hypothetical protein